MKWERVPGKRDWTAEANGRRYLLHVGHGELWYALVVSPTGSSTFAPNPYQGPQALENARAWCETQASLHQTPQSISESP